MSFKITMPGKYRMRNGGVVVIAAYSAGSVFPWRPESDGIGEGYREDGSFDYEPDGRDIVGRIDEPQEMAGLIGFVAIKRLEGGLSTSGRDTLRELRNDYSDYSVIDLSKVPISALVKKAPTRVEGWLNLQWDKNHPGETVATGPFSTREEASDSFVEDEDGPRIACIRVEFSEGDGL